MSHIVIDTFLIVAGVSVLAVSSFVSDRELQRLDTILVEEHALVSEIFSDLNSTRELLERYLQDGLPATLVRYNNVYPALLDRGSRFAAIPGRTSEDDRTVIDFRFMIQTYLEEANGAVLSKQDGDLAASNRHLQEVRKIGRLITPQLESLFDVMTHDSERMRHEVERLRRLSLAAYVVLISAVALLLVVLILQTSRRVIEPIDTLTKAARRVTAGDLDPDLGSENEYYEIAAFRQAFASMLQTLREQLDHLEESARIESKLREEELQNQRMATLVREAELKALQARINPHFLFNTLNMISQMAYIESAEATASLLEATSSLLRYTIDNLDKGVCVSDEVKHIKDYIFIQNLRFGERIRFSLTCDDDAMKAELPCFTIQPILENAIAHGVKLYIKDARVSVVISSDSGNIRLVVADNGVGMNAERLEEVRNATLGLGKRQAAGIGIQNVYERLSLYFGRAPDFSIESRCGEGTIVSFGFPARYRSEA